MDALAGPYLASALLLVVAGATKVRDRLPLVRALRSARLPAPVAGVRLVAVGETALRAAAVLVGGRLTPGPWRRPGALAVRRSDFQGGSLVLDERTGIVSSVPGGR